MLAATAVGLARLTPTTAPATGKRACVAGTTTENVAKTAAEAVSTQLILHQLIHQLELENITGIRILDTLLMVPHLELFIPGNSF